MATKTKVSKYTEELNNRILRKSPKLKKTGLASSSTTKKRIVVTGGAG